MCIQDKINCIFTLLVQAPASIHYTKRQKTRKQSEIRLNSAQLIILFKFMVVYDKNLHFQELLEFKKHLVH